MRFVRNDLLNRELSVLGFGSAAVLGRVGKRDSLAAMGAAVDAGINVFDTARSYGYGEGETLLGEFLQGRRTQVAIFSKFGILPAKLSPWKQAAKPIAQALISAVPGVRNRIRGKAASQFDPGQFTVETMKSSVETSLRALRTDYLDILFMHEPGLDQVLNQDLQRAMEDLVRAGKVRLAGVAAPPDVAAVAQTIPAIKAIQFICQIGNRFADLLPVRTGTHPILRFAAHPFGGLQTAVSLQAKLAAGHFTNDLPAPLCKKLLDGDRQDILTDLVLNCALQGNESVLVTMMKPEHLRKNAAALSQSRFEAGELTKLRSWIISAVAQMPQETAQ